MPPASRRACEAVLASAVTCAPVAMAVSTARSPIMSAGPPIVGGIMAEAAEKVKSCSICGALDVSDPCAVCADQSRDGGLICVIEEVGALWALERGGSYRGRYHVLGALL